MFNGQCEEAFYDAERIYHALAENGTVLMPIKKTS
jgi:hypothetical protein